MENFTPLASALGGVLIGLASAMLLVANGRIAGISGITGGVLRLQKGETLWRALFVLGLVAGGAIAAWISPSSITFDLDRSAITLVVAGLFVGVGTQMGNGCTSGHGVCGVSRFSKRSMVSVVTFMGVAALVVWIVGMFGGAL